MIAHLRRELDSQCTIFTDANAAVANSLNANAVIGVDEVGRGCVFGNMTVAAVILPTALTGLLETLKLADTPLKLLNDSKKLTEKRREQLFASIHGLAAGFVIVDVPRALIDEINIAQATLLGMRVAIETLMSKHQLHAQNTQLLIDGNAAPRLLGGIGECTETHTIIKGDATHSSIACASILAKVHRDRLMLRYGEQFPEYALQKHKGYLTAAHKAALMTHGITPEHRRSFAPVSQMYRDGWINQRYW